MIELYLKTNEVKKLDLISEIDTDAKDLFNIRIIDFTDSELTEVSEKFGIDMSILIKEKILK
jgi:magnesium transporter